MVSIDLIKQLRQETGVSVSECKKALEEANGDFDKAKELLRKWGRELAGKKAERDVKAGIVAAYIHPNKQVGVLVELQSESDFVAKNEDFQKLAHELCLQIAAMKPLFLAVKDVPEAVIDGERKIFTEQLKDAGKPAKVVKQIIDNKIKKYKEEISLLQQAWIKDDSKTIQDVINEAIARLGENIVIKDFVRYEI